jgi:hypothetical protein
MFNYLCNVVDYFTILGDMEPKHKSGCAKRNKRKRDLALAESQQGALKRYFPTTSSVDVIMIIKLKNLNLIKMMIIIEMLIMRSMNSPWARVTN